MSNILLVGCSQGDGKGFDPNAAPNHEILWPQVPAAGDIPSHTGQWACLCPELCSESRSKLWFAGDGSQFVESDFTGPVQICHSLRSY